MNVSPADAGNIMINGKIQTVFPYSCSNPATLEAMPGDDYVFSGWGGGISGSENPYTLTIPSSGISIIVNFRLKTIPINLSTAKSMLNTDKDVIVMDVRTETEFDEGHILCALNYSWPRPSYTHDSEEAGRDGRLYYDYGDILPYQDHDIIVHCKSGTRSGQAVQFLADNGFTHIYDMTDGMDGWIDAGYETTTANAECSYPPMAYAGADQTVDEGSTVTLNGSGSSVTGGSIVSYLWTQTGGAGNVELSDRTSPTPTFIAPNESIDVGDTLIFTLVTTSDSGATDTDSVEIQVNGVNYPPTADAGPDQSVSQGATVTLDGTASSDSDGIITSYKWRMTSGNNIIPTDISLSDDTSASLVFTAPAKDCLVNFRLTVTDDEGGTGADSIRIIVQGGSSTQEQIYQAVMQERLRWNAGGDNRLGIKEAVLAIQTAAGIRIQVAGFVYDQEDLDQAVMQERQRWDVNGDNRMGLEEAIRALQVTVGIQ